MAGAGKAAAKFGVAQVELEVEIAAIPQRVWDALVGETTAWWHRDFYTSELAKGFIIEPKLGGRVYEDWGADAGQIWYTVIGIEPSNSLMLQGILTATFGGPATTILEIKLKSEGKGTRVQISDTIFGNIGDDKLSQTKEGWKMLFEDGLKAHVEGK